MRKIFFIISSFHSGGAERVASNLINKLSEEFSIEVATLSPKSEDFYSVGGNNTIRHHININSRNKLFANIERILKLRKLIKSSNTKNIISFVDQMNILSIFACFGLRKNLIISERTNPKAHSLGRFWDALRFLTYRFCDKIVLQTKGLSLWAEQEMKISSSKIFIIGNPITEFTQSDDINVEGDYILSIGRLDKHKGFDFVISNFKNLKETYHNLSLIIIGDGPEKENLIDLSKRLSIQSKVHFLGKIDNPYPYYKRSKLLMLCSKYEGFPNVLLESTSLGIPTISFDCDFGPRDILPKEYLVPYGDKKLLLQKSLQILQDTEITNIFKRHSQQINSKFSLDSVIGKWIKLLV